MWNKLYLVALGLSMSVMAFFTYYSWSWLQSIGSSNAAMAGFEYHSSLALTALWLSTGILLILGNAILWDGGKAWGLWVTFLYFSIFIAIRLLWLNRAYSYFVEKYTGLETSVDAAPFVAVVFIVLAAVIVFFDQFIVVRMHRKMYPTEVAGPPETAFK